MSKLCIEIIYPGKCPHRALLHHTSLFSLLNWRAKGNRAAHFGIPRPCTRYLMQNWLWGPACNPSAECPRSVSGWLTLSFSSSQSYPGIKLSSASTSPDLSCVFTDKYSPHWHLSECPCALCAIKEISSHFIPLNPTNISVRDILFSLKGHAKTI